MKKEVLLGNFGGMFFSDVYPKDQRRDNKSMNKQTEKRVLDPCCGGKSMWFDPDNKDAAFMDIRSGRIELHTGRSFVVAPDIIGDVREIPYPNESFYLVVLDPPHLKYAGERGWLAKRYGKLDKGSWRSFIKQAFEESMRVLKPNGTLIFKWSEVDIKVSEVIDAIGVQPLFGHRTRQHGCTIWMTFLK